MKYRVVREKDKSETVVISDNPGSAALKGAIKLGVRHLGRKPTMAVDLHHNRTYYQPYCYDKRLNASCNCYDPVIVSEKE